jgi:hypothetical protein
VLLPSEIPKVGIYLRVYIGILDGRNLDVEGFGRQKLGAKTQTTVTCMID